MIRKQVYIEERHDRLLKRRARQRGVTEAEIIREALDQVVAHRTAGGLNPAAGRKALSFMRAMAVRRQPRGPSSREWSREELYEERVGRWRKS
jgi:hypothetical protein